MSIRNQRREYGEYCQQWYGLYQGLVREPAASVLGRGEKNDYAEHETYCD